MKRYGQLEVIVTDKLQPYGAAMKDRGTRLGKKQADGRTSALRIRNYRFEGENGRCKVSGACEVCKNPLPYTLPFSTTSIRNVIFTHATISSRTVPPLWQSGAVSARSKGQTLYPNRNEFEFV